MKIIVFNGSPKGDISVTMQYIHYIQKKFPSHELKILNISSEIKQLESNESKWQEVISDINRSDGIIWATPVYYFLVPAQLKRFIELIHERKQENLLTGKYTMALVTSIHCYDHTAVNYLAAVSEDLGMNYVGGLSPEMEDLTDAQKRQNILDFADYYFQSITTKRPVFKTFSPLLETSSEYRPENLTAVPKSQSKKVVLLTDNQELPSNLGRMIEAFKTSAPFEVEVLNLNDVEIKGGCLGCLHCGYDNVCAYKDEVKSFIQDKLKPAASVIIAGEMQDRYLSSRWKLFFDRSFVFGHTPVLHQKQIGVLISGPLRQNSNLLQILEGYVQLQESNLVGIVTDEDSSGEITQNLKTLADKVSWGLEHHIMTNDNYLSVGVNLLFQQFVPRARGIFHADHLYYKKHGLYQRHKKSSNLVFNTIVGIGNHFAGFRREFNKKIKAGMIAGLQKIVNHQ